MHPMSSIFNEIDRRIRRAAGALSIGAVDHLGLSANDEVDGEGAWLLEHVPEVDAEVVVEQRADPVEVDPENETRRVRDRSDA